LSAPVQSVINVINDLKGKISKDSGLKSRTFITVCERSVAYGIRTGRNPCLQRQNLKALKKTFFLLLSPCGGNPEGKGGLGGLQWANPQSHSKEKRGTNIFLIYNFYSYDKEKFQNTCNSVSVRFNDNRVWRRRLKERLAK
jgi:hypothetical protein